jgi:hypothetical protein
MAGLVPAIHVLLQHRKKDVDGRHEAGRDVERADARHFAVSRGCAIEGGIDADVPAISRSAPIHHGARVRISPTHCRSRPSFTNPTPLKDIVERSYRGPSVAR